MLTDTHCHLAEPLLLHDLPAVLAQAAAVDVCRFIVPATCRADFNAVLSLHRVPDIQIALGIHPWFAGEAVKSDFNELERLLIKHSHAFVGEIGLDFHDKNLLKSSREQQTECLLQQLEYTKVLGEHQDLQKINTIYLDMVRMTQIHTMEHTHFQVTQNL